MEHDPGTGGVISQYGTAALTGSGLWAVGDRVIQLASAVGLPEAWRCTVARNPGTGSSEGNLGNDGWTNMPEHESGQAHSDVVVNDVGSIGTTDRGEQRAS